MKKALPYYIITLLIILTAIISVKSIRHKIGVQSNAIDTLFFKIFSYYQMQYNTAGNLKEMIIKTEDISPGSLQLPKGNIHGINPSTSHIKFNEMIEYQKYEDSIDLFKQQLKQLERSSNFNHQAMILELNNELENQSVRTGELIELYNERVFQYNLNLRTFPNNFYAIFFHFQSKPPFKRKKE